MKRILFSLTIFAAITITNVPAIADHLRDRGWRLHSTFAKLPKPTDCDRLAANPLDPWRVVRHGVPFKKIDAPKAISACNAAMRVAKSKFPNGDYPLKATRTEQNRILRFLYQLARAHSAAGNAKKSFQINSGAETLGYPYSKYYTYLKYRFGSGVPKNMNYAKQHLKAAVNAGVPMARLDSAELDLDGPRPDFMRIAGELYKAELGHVSTILAWAKYHEKLGEHMLRLAGRGADLYEKPTSTLSGTDLRITFFYTDIRNYQRNLQTALQFHLDYFKNHPKDASTKMNIRRLKDRIETIKSAADKRLKDMYPK